MMKTPQSFAAALDVSPTSAFRLVMYPAEQVINNNDSVTFLHHTPWLSISSKFHVCNDICCVDIHRQSFPWPSNKHFRGALRHPCANSRIAIFVYYLSVPSNRVCLFPMYGDWKPLGRSQIFLSVLSYLETPIHEKSIRIYKLDVDECMTICKQGNDFEIVVVGAMGSFLMTQVLREKHF